MSRIPNCAKVLLMKRGFSLVELIVSVVIVSLISGGALVYLNKFNSRQKLEKTKEEIVASIKLVQSYAKGRQLPTESTAQLNYIKLKMEGDYLQALVNDTSDNYFSNLVNADEITVTVNPSLIYFWAGGRLSFDTDPINTEFYGVNDTAVVNVVNSGQAGGSYQIMINALGQVSEVKYVE